MVNYVRTLFLALLLLLLGAPLAPVGAVDLKVATVVPDGSSWMVAMRQGGGEIRQRTAGRVNLKFYAGGVMGNDQSVLRKIRIGQLHGGAFTSGALTEDCPNLGLYSFPLFFRSADEVDYIRSRHDTRLIEELRQAGFVSYGFAQGGFAMLMSDRPIRALSDLYGQKIWVPEGDVIAYRTMQALGLAPVSLPITDVMTGLQTGLVTIIATSPVGAVAFQWHTKIKYVTDVPLTYIYGTLAFDRKVVERLSSDDQQVLGEVMARIYRELDRDNRRDNQSALMALTRQGIQLVAPAPAEIEQWRGKTGVLARQLRDEGVYSAELYDALQRDLAEFRRGRGGPVSGAERAPR